MASDSNGSSSNFFTNDLDRNNVDRDLYAILHINKDADAATLQQAYRRLTLFYHPDKHTDPRTKQLAMDLFIQVKNAYDILSDPQKRAIYDVLGMKGLKTEGWDIVTRTRTPREILDEYERLAKEREDRRFEQMTNANVAVNTTLDLTDLFYQLNETDENKILFSDSFPNIKRTEFSVQQSIDVPLTSQDTVTTNALATIRNDRGVGLLTTSFRRVLSHLSWFRIDLAFSQRPQIGIHYFRRITQKLQANVHTTFICVTERRLILNAGFLFSISYQLARNLTSSLQWKTGRGSFMKGILQYGNEKWTISGAIQLGLTNTYGAIDGVYRFPNICNLQCSIKLFIFGPWIEYGIDRQLTKHTHGSATVAISSKMGVLLRLKLTRGSQIFTIPLPLSKNILPSAVFYATITPAIAYLVLDRLIIQPFIRLEQERQQKRHEEEEREKQIDRRREAMNAQELLRSLVEQIKEKEGSDGLIILEAYYGQLTPTIDESPMKIVDVRIPLQTLVKDSTLKIETTASKSNLTGFYDPCIGEEKSLFIKYSFHSQIHTVTYSDKDPVILPNRNHLLL